ncbi:MAG: ABC transporter permease [Planctomycetes bacterium]|nr:ABC transporter permease [Planctomycetota bacterium]
MPFVKRHAIPILFLLVCGVAAGAAEIQPEFLVREVLARLSRDTILVLSLIVPVLAGMGLNFGIVLGAMAGQIGIILVVDRQIEGLPGLTAAILLGLLFGSVLGAGAGWVLNRTRGREMLTGMIMGFFAGGLYQLVFIVLAGSVLPFRNPDLLLPAGPGDPPVGLRNTIDLKTIKGRLDLPGTEDSSLRAFTSLKVPVFWEGPNPETGELPPPFQIPVLTFGVVGAAALAVGTLSRTKLGQDLRAVGQDPHIAEVAGIPVGRIRIFAITFSTAMAALGQCVSLQNLGTMNTYSSHEQIGFTAIAALVMGGASVDRATLGQAFAGTILFHTLFVVSPIAGQKFFNDPQIGEYFRVFIAYGVIALSLGLHAWKARRSARPEADAPAD